MREHLTKSLKTLVKNAIKMDCVYAWKTRWIHRVLHMALGENNNIVGTGKINATLRAKQKNHLNCSSNFSLKVIHTFISRRIASPELTTEALPGNALFLACLPGLVAAIGEPDIEIKSQWGTVDQRVRERPEI